MTARNSEDAKIPDSAACASGKERPLDAELGAAARTPQHAAPAVSTDAYRWEPPEVDLGDSIERLRKGALRMIERGRENPADYGPINIWPHTVLALLKEADRG